MAVFWTVAREAQAEFVEKKSRFIGYAASVESEEEAHAFIRSVRARNKGASCNASAYILHDNLQRFSDAGEPAGTAGKPILAVISGADLTDTMVVVTRYFGGTLLGTGGLVRAYAKAATLAIAEAGRAKKVAAARYSISFDYPLAQALEDVLQQRGWEIVQKTYLGKVSFTCLVPLDEQELFIKNISELSKNEANILLLDDTSFLRQAD